jgi:hypothetical protein
MAEESLELADPLDPNDVHAAEKLVREQERDFTSRKQDALRIRQDAYRRVFAGNPFSGDADIVLNDLKRFCRGNQTPWSDDARVHALLTGRFEVYNRIINHLTMSLDDLWEMLEGPVNE